MPAPVWPRPVAATLLLTLVAGCAGPRRAGPARLPTLAPAVVTDSSPPASPRSTRAIGLATDVVRRYYLALDELRRQMRASRLERLLAPDCPCRAQLRAIRAAGELGERYTDRIRIIATLPHLDRSDLVDVFVSFDVDQGGLVDRLGHRIGRVTNARNVHRELVVRRLAGTWLIERVLAV